MDKSKENDVLLHLYNYKNEEKLEKLPEYPFFDHTVVAQVSKSISDIIYKSFKRNNPRSVERRDTLIELITNWTGSNTPKLTAETDYNILIKSLITNRSFKEEIFEKYGQTLANEIVQKPNENWSQICNTITKKYKTYLQSKIKIGLVDIYQQKHFENAGFEFSLPIKPLQNFNAEAVIDFVEHLNDTQPLINNATIPPNINSKTVVNEETNINLCLAILKLETNSVNERVFIQIIKDLSVNKSPKVLKFINYIWCNNLSSTLAVQVFKIYPFIYEKSILELSTRILEDSTASNDYKTIINQSNINEIMTICALDVDLSNNIVLILDLVIELSEMDVRILKMVNILKNKYFKGFPLKDLQENNT